MKRFLILVVLLFVCFGGFAALEVDVNAPIVDPNIWYQMQVNDGVRTAWIAVVAIAGIGLVIVIVVFLYCASDSCYTWEDNKVKISLWCFSILLLISLIITGSLISIYTPSSETMLKMGITQQITPANIDGVEQDIKGVVDYIIEKVKELK